MWKVLCVELNLLIIWFLKPCVQQENVWISHKNYILRQSVLVAMKLGNKKAEARLMTQTGGLTTN